MLLLLLLLQLLLLLLMIILESYVRVNDNFYLRIIVIAVASFTAGRWFLILNLRSNWNGSCLINKCFLILLLLLLLWRKQKILIIILLHLLLVLRLIMNCWLTEHALYWFWLVEWDKRAGNCVKSDGFFSLFRKIHVNNVLLFWGQALHAFVDLKGWGLLVDYIWRILLFWLFLLFFFLLLETCSKS